MADPLPLRAHNLLCLQGFRGRGYSEAFVEAMTDVHARLKADPTTEVRVLASPDTLCAACPNLSVGPGKSDPEGSPKQVQSVGGRPSDDRRWSTFPRTELGGGGCTLGGPDHEAHMRAQDEDVIRRMDLVAGQVLPYSEVLHRIRASVRGADLPTICTTCPWLSLGWCAQGIDALR